MHSEEYIKHLVMRGYSRETISGRDTSFTMFKKFLSLYNISDKPNDWDRDTFVKFYTFLNDYRFSFCDNSKTGYITEKSRRNYTKRSLSKETILIYMRNMKDYLKYLFESGEIDSFPFETIDIHSKSKRKLKSDISESDINKIVKAIPLNDALGFRNRTMIELIYGTGLRKGETSRLDIGDINTEDRYIIVHGKGKKQRIIPIGNVAIKYVTEYVKDVRIRILSSRNLSEKALFLSDRGRLRANSIGKIITECGRAAGVYDLSAHKLRHAFALHMMRRGCDIRYIQEILGHERLATTTIYTEVYDYDLIEKIREFHPGND